MAAITTGERALLSQLQITGTCQLLLPPGRPAAAIRLQTTPKKQPGAPPSHPHPQTSTQLSSAQEQALILQQLYGCREQLGYLKDLQDSPCTQSRTCCMQCSSGCPRAAAHRGRPCNTSSECPCLLPMYFQVTKTPLFNKVKIALSCSIKPCQRVKSR